MQLQALKEKHKKQVQSVHNSEGDRTIRGKHSINDHVKKKIQKTPSIVKKTVLESNSPPQLKKLAEVGEQVSREKKRALKKLRRKFGRLSTLLKNEGTATNPLNPHLKRISFSKDKFSPQQLMDLGFKSVNIAIPEKGQVSFKSFRHPLSNHHIHDHGGKWVMHEDAHSALPMIRERLRLKNLGKLRDMVGPDGKLRKLVTPKSYAEANMQGMTHLFGEGARGLAGYVKNVVTGGERVLDKVESGLSEKTKEKLRRL